MSNVSGNQPAATPVATAMVPLPKWGGAVSPPVAFSGSGPGQAPADPRTPSQPEEAATPRTAPFLGLWRPSCGDLDWSNADWSAVFTPPPQERRTVVGSATPLPPWRAAVGPAVPAPAAPAGDTAPTAEAEQGRQADMAAPEQAGVIADRAEPIVVRRVLGACSDGRSRVCELMGGSVTILPGGSYTVLPPLRPKPPHAPPPQSVLLQHVVKKLHRIEQTQQSARTYPWHAAMGLGPWSAPLSPAAHDSGIAAPASPSWAASSSSEPEGPRTYPAGAHPAETTKYRKRAIPIIRPSLRLLEIQDSERAKKQRRLPDGEAAEPAASDRSASECAGLMPGVLAAGPVATAVAAPEAPPPLRPASPGGAHSMDMEEEDEPTWACNLRQMLEAESLHRRRREENRQKRREAREQATILPGPCGGSDGGDRSVVVSEVVSKPVHHPQSWNEVETELAVEVPPPQVAQVAPEVEYEEVELEPVVLPSAATDAATAPGATAPAPAPESGARVSRDRSISVYLDRDIGGFIR